MKILTIKVSGNELQQRVTDETTIQDSPTDVLNTWSNCFSIVKEDPDNEVKGLRNPQIGAIHSILSLWTNTNEIGTVVLPTGTGKTETMLSVLVLEKIPKLLVIVPTDSLRTQIRDKFISLGLLTTLNLVPDAVKLPVVGTIKTSFASVEELKDFSIRSNVIVATASILSRMNSAMIEELHSQCSHVL